MVFRPRLNKEQKDIIPVPSSGATPEEWLNKFHRANRGGRGPDNGISTMLRPRQDIHDDEDCSCLLNQNVKKETYRLYVRPVDPATSFLPVSLMAKLCYKRTEDTK